MKTKKNMRLLKTFFIFLVSALVSFSGQSQINYQQKIRLNEGWEFLRGDIGNIWEAVRPESGDPSERVPRWEAITLPHCYNAFDAVDPDVNYYQGPGWYRTQLAIHNPYEKGRTILHFEGVGQKAQVYVYMEEVGSHVGGYDEWQVDITEAVNRFFQSDDSKRFGGKVPIEIRVDNSRDTEMIPSDLSDFNLYGGIYRYLNLVYTPPLAFRSIQTHTTTDEKGKRGELSIKVAFDNFSGDTIAQLNIKIYSPDNRLIKDEEVALKNFEEQEILFAVLSEPALWSPDDPQLYSCRLTLTTCRGTMQCEERFGFRHFEFKEKGPFYLNGKRLLLRGMHRHEDFAGLGAAMTEELIREEMRMIKSTGANFIRLAHYQQSRIVLEECDRLGLLVWEEIPWCRGGLGGEKYREQVKRMLTNMITQHRNHPCVILWGLGNENDWPGDFPEFDKQKIRAFMQELHSLAHRIDDSRLTCIRRCEFCKDIVDVYSPSIWAGWYSGRYTDYKRVSYHEMQQVNRFFHAEWGGDSHARRHSENPYLNLDKVETGEKKADERVGDALLYGGKARASRDGDWSETYICDLIDWHLKEQETMPWLTGSAYWIFKDFSTPTRPINPIPYMNQKGIVERDLTPKESFYVFQSYWAEKPMVHIYGHGWPIRWGEENEVKTLKVYSNCNEVELFLNGKSLGIKKRDSQDFPAAGLRWETTLAKGNNTVKAVAWKGRETVTDEITFEYETRKFGEETAIRAKVVEETGEYAWIEAEFVDRNGIRCLTSRKNFRFDSVGDGYLVVNMGTSNASKKVEAYNGRALVKLIKKGKKNIVSVSADGFDTVFIEI